METPPPPDALLRCPALTAEQWEYAIEQLKLHAESQTGCKEHVVRKLPSVAREDEARPPGCPVPATPPSSTAASVRSGDDDDDDDPVGDSRLGIPSVDLRDEQMWLDTKQMTFKLPKMNIEAKNAIWSRGKIIGVIWRGWCATAHAGKRRWILTHYRKDYPGSSLLYIKGQRRRVLTEPIF